MKIATATLAIVLIAGASAAQTAKAAAPIDLTGYWVSVISEDWRYRMVMPLKGDFRGIPLNAEGTRVANTWTPTATEPAAEQCKPYGAAAIMRIPTRLHVTWQDDSTLRLDTDAGTQTRLLHFEAGRAGEAGRSQAPSWQGTSAARWDRAGRGAPAVAAGALTVVTTNLRPGYLRRNGVPYSEDAWVTEYFDLSPLPGNGQLLIVTTVVEDPRYLRQPYILSSHFKKEADGSKWDPTPCTTTW
ncbi:MAG: hypothetical protein DMF88_06690 [Acidobacteria bacterium]|nr:MAG: hypothetical protein DMF88_06690 [Acidobacteriota bacterium]